MFLHIMRSEGRPVEETSKQVISLALEFLFKKGIEVLKKRFERRKKEGKEKAKPETSVEKSILATNRAELEASKIDQTILFDIKGEIEHVLKLIKIHMNNYRLAEKQYALWGEELVPPIIKSRLEEAEKAIENDYVRLGRLMEKVYGKQILKEPNDI